MSAGMFAEVEADSFVSLVLDELEPSELTLATRPHETLAVVSNYTEVPADVDIAIVELGTNDVGIPTPDDEFREGYDELLSQIRASSPEARLICVGTWTGWGWTQDEIIRSSCEKFSGVYVHLRDLFDDEKNHGEEGKETFLGNADWFHPNSDGHAAIARRILVALDQFPQ